MPRKVSEQELSKRNFFKIKKQFGRDVGGSSLGMYATLNCGLEPLYLVPSFRFSALTSGPYINLPRGSCQVPGTSSGTRS